MSMFVQRTFPQAPCSRKTMALSDRVLNALTGFALIDLFRLLSDKECARRGLPKGALFLAPETARNLQHSALAVVSVGLTKSSEGCYWSNGHQRLSELPVECHFGRLRTQSSSAQLSARSFWSASARDMLRSSSRKQVGDPPVQKKIDPLTEEEFLVVSNKALRSALRLAAWCQNCSVSSLSETYDQWCKDSKHEDFRLYFYVLNCFELFSIV